MVEKAVSFEKSVFGAISHRKNTKIIVYLKTYLEYSYPIGITNKFGVHLNNTVSKVAIWMVIALILFSIFRQFDGTRNEWEISYSQFMEEADREL